MWLNLLQVCRNINQIKICMGTGRTVILVNQEILYESLYDVLNQVNYNFALIFSLYAMHNNSTTLNYENIDLLTLDCKIIVLSAEWTISLSMYTFCLSLTILLLCTYVIAF